MNSFSQWLKTQPLHTQKSLNRWTVAMVVGGGIWLVLSALFPILFFQLLHIEPGDEFGVMPHITLVSGFAWKSTVLILGYFTSFSLFFLLARIANQKAAPLEDLYRVQLEGVDVSVLVELYHQKNMSWSDKKSLEYFLTTHHPEWNAPLDQPEDPSIKRIELSVAHAENLDQLLSSHDTQTTHKMS